MDTKLKNFSRNAITKFIASIITVLMIATAVMQISYVDWREFNIEPLMVGEYKDSNNFINEVNDAFHSIYLYFDDDDEMVMEDIERQLEEIDYIYYISDGEKTLTNKEDFNKEDFINYGNSFFEYDDGRMKSDENANESFMYWFTAEEDVTIYIAFSDAYMDQQQSDWNDAYDTLGILAIIFITCIVVAVALIVYLISVTGRKPNKDELQRNWVDSLYSEILLITGVIIISLCLIYISEMNYFNMDQTMAYIYSMGIVTAIGAFLSGVVLLALVRKIKDRRFFKDFLIYRICHRIIDFPRSFFDGRRFEKYPLTKNLFRRQVTFIIVSCILVLLTFILIWTPLIIFPPILEIIVIYWYVKYNNETYDEINKGFNESLEEQMKSERMKIELVTNVSHDLKTPLTSIISYVDLLSKEENLSETARDYIKILGEKSERLKNIVSDLFDLAKSTSGDINLNLETIDMKKLVEQTLGDMGDEIEKSGLRIKTNLPESPVNILSDGNRLYRVIQNVLDNALKYSLKGTRIFIELEEKDGRAVATIKNTAAYEIDFTEEEILQRFNRGDRSRTTEGSGLGLSIAESFTNVSGGTLKVDIDGDMFKVIISFPLA